MNKIILTAMTTLNAMIIIIIESVKFTTAILPFFIMVMFIENSSLVRSIVAFVVLKPLFTNRNVYDPTVAFSKLTNPVPFVKSSKVPILAGWEIEDTRVSFKGLLLGSRMHSVIVPVFREASAEVEVEV